MSFITDMFNTQKGSAYNATSAPVIGGTNSGRIDDTYNQSQQGLSQQQAFLQALQAQNGIQNQSQVYNQLQDIAAGRGPNPAMAALANATGANTANQAALMAGQRGASQNAGLIARQAANQGAANQQNAIGQGAALQAQQSMNAIGQAGQMAGQQVGQQAGALGTYNQLAQNQQGIQQSALANQNNANVAMQSNINNANSGVAQKNAENQNDLGSGVLSTLTGGLGSIITGKKAEGGLVEAPQMFANGGAPTLGALPGGSGDDFWGTHMSGGDGVIPLANYAAPVAAAPSENKDSAGRKAGMDMGSLAGTAAKAGFTALTGVPLPFSQGGKVPSLVSPGERYLPPDEVEKVAQGRKDPLEAGKKIPGKAKYKGNDYRNDTVPMELEEGGIVLPKSVMESKNPHWEAHKFVSAIMAKNGRLPAKKVTLK